MPARTASSRRWPSTAPATCMPSGRAPTAPTSGSSTRRVRRTGTGAPRSTSPTRARAPRSRSSTSTRRATCSWCGRRSDGTNLRIQAAFKPVGGSFAAPVTVSDPGFDATEPQVDFDNTGKAIAVWQRFDGTKLRVQATIRTAGAGGRVRERGDALRARGRTRSTPQSRRGSQRGRERRRRLDRSDGTNLRVQSSRRRDVVGYPRPKGASPIAGLAGAGVQRVQPSPNRTHGPPLVFPSCNPPSRSSGVLTVGTPDANGFAANSVSSVKFKVDRGERRQRRPTRPTSR